MPVVMPTVTGTRANIARQAGRTPKRPSAQRAMDAERYLAVAQESVERRALRRFGSNALQPGGRNIRMIHVALSCSIPASRLRAGGSSGVYA